MVPSFCAFSMPLRYPHLSFAITLSTYEIYFLNGTRLKTPAPLAALYRAASFTAEIS